MREQPIKPRLVPILSLLGIGLFVAWAVWLPSPVSVDPSDGVDLAPVAEPGLPAAPRTALPTQPAGIESPDATNLIYRKPPPETLEALMQQPEAIERMNAYEHQRQAAQRFSEAVTEGGFEVEDLNRSVVSFFNTFELEAVLDEEAMIVGLELSHIYGDSPIRRAGFVEGDLITKINDERLHDPADVPALFEGLERDLSLCVDRDGSEVCGRIVLD